MKIVWKFHENFVKSNRKFSEERAWAEPKVGKQKDALFKAYKEVANLN